MWRECLNLAQALVGFDYPIDARFPRYPAPNRKTASRRSLRNPMLCLDQAAKIAAVARG